MRVLYLTTAGFDRPSAAGLRIAAVASAMALAGHEVVVVPPEQPATTAWLPPLPDGVTVEGARPAGGAGGARGDVANLVGRSHGPVGRLLDRRRPDVVVLYQSWLPLAARLRAAGRRRGVPLVLDVTEWYDAAALPLGRFGPHNLLTQLSMRWFVPRSLWVLAVSGPLAEHCGRRGARTLVVPPLSLAAETPLADVAPADDGRVSVVATMSGIGAGEKDGAALVALARAAEAVDPDGARLAVAVVGPAPEEVTARLGGRVPAALRLLGPRDWREVLALTAAADLSFMLRDEGVRRLTMGVPSKVPESLVLGTPVLGNPVGDLAQHLVDGVNAVLLPGTREADVAAGLRRVLDGSLRFDRDAIRADARERFAPEAWAPRLDAFLRSVAGGA